MQRQFTCALFLTLICSAAQLNAKPSDEVFGIWASDGSVIEITQQNQQLSAKIVAIKDALYRADEEDIKGIVGTPRKDDLNPDEALRERFLIGLELLSDYRHNGKRWEGKIYDPESGNTYSSRMHVDKDGNLKMRGYIGISLLGRTAVFLPVTTCNADIKEMYNQSSVVKAPCDAPK